jgi:two-component system sensor histidine kinase BarA
VGNALKFTPPGGSVRIAVRHLAETQSIQVAVSDTGIGIAPDAREQIFDEFAQIHRGVKGRHREGSGLGLAIARRIVEAHRGTLDLSSGSGKGSTFYFNIPVDARQQNVSSAVSA